jgi:NAD(P)H-flavin reductase
LSWSPRVSAPAARRLLEVSANEALGAYRLLRLADPDGPAPAPGQFAMLAGAAGWGGGEDGRPYLARALSYAGWREGEAIFLLEDIGPGTRLLCGLEAGDRVWSLGPLGNGFTAPPAGARALLVGGGVGIAPLAILREALTQDGAPTTALLGFRDGPRALSASLLAGARVATDDGSAGHHGLVSDLLREELARARDALVYACGPVAMLESVRALCESAGVHAQLALEAPMACGFGACFGCVVPLRAGGYARVCVDGPVLDAALLASVEEHAGAPA